MATIRTKFSLRFCAVLSYRIMFDLCSVCGFSWGVLMNITCHEVSYKYTIRLRLPQGMCENTCVVYCQGVYDNRYGFFL